MHVLAANIGTPRFKSLNWPTNDLDGLFEALRRWPLNPRHDLSRDPEFAGKPGVAPFRGHAWGHCVKGYDPALQRTIWIATRPVYPSHPDAVRYAGNFAGYSFGFCLDTDAPELIEKLDRAIADNLRRSQDDAPPSTAPKTASNQILKESD